MTKIALNLLFLCFVLLLAGCHSDNDPVEPLELTRGPYLQIATPTSIIIKWRSSIPTYSVVYYGSSIHNLSSRVRSPSPTIDHEILLENLQPDTRYYYHVDNIDRQPATGNVDFSFVTSPSQGTNKPTRIWVLGDSGTANSNAAAVRDAYKTFTGTREAELMLMLGDNAYRSGTDEEYQLAVFDMYPSILRKIPIWPTFGNHEGHSSNSKDETGPYYDIFTLPTNGEAGGVSSNTEAYYSFDFANIHFISLNSHDIDKSPTGQMLTWLKNDLETTNQVWRIAYWHHPPYSKGTHNSDTVAAMIKMRENVLSILETYGVDLVFSGHSHVYERSFLLDSHYGGSTTLSAIMILDNGDGQISGDGAYTKPGIEGTPHEGTVYTVMGSSGKSAAFRYPFHPTMYSSIESLGSLVLDISNYQLDMKFIDEKGATRDFFTIHKGP